MRLLVSLCNLPYSTSSPLVLIDTDQAMILPIDVGARGEASGALGLCRTVEGIYCAWIGAGSESYLSLLDSGTLEPVEVGSIDGVRDVHSIASLDDWLYIVSTGTDEVRRVRTRQPFESSEVVWQASEARSDTHHINAIVPMGARLLCSAFGTKRGERWSTALDGYVVDIGSGEVLWQGIEHPHSLAVWRDTLYVAESRRGRIRGLRGGHHVSLDGYARGLAISPEGLAVAGASSGRARSRSLGTIENPADPGERSGETSVTVFDLSKDGAPRGGAHRFDLSARGPEIYDIVILDA